MSNKKTIKSISKSIEIIDLISKSNEGLGSTEIGNELNLSISSIQHILTTLKVDKVLTQDNSTKKYKLGIKMIKIGKKAQLQNEILIKIKPYLKKIVNLTGETSSLIELDNANISYIAQEQSKQTIRMFVEIGKNAPVYCSGAGKMLLALSSNKMKELIIPQIQFIKYTENTILNKNDLLKELKKIKVQGYAYDFEEREMGVRCVALPILDSNQEAQFAISVSGPTHRFSKEKMVSFKKIIKDIIEVMKKEITI